MKLIKAIKNIINYTVIRIKYKNIYIKNVTKSNISSKTSITAPKGYITIEDRLTIRKNARIGVANGGKIKIQSCYINENSLCISRGQIIIGKDVSIGPNVCIYDHDHAFNDKGKINDKYKIGTITIGDNVWIGAGAIILKDTVIGKNSIIGAGTVVKGIIPQNSIVKNNRELIIQELRKNK